MNALNSNNINHNATVPTTIGALLTEEYTIDPLSHLPSFLELTFVDVARNSGRVALSAAWDVVVVYLKGLEDRLARLEQMMIHRVANFHVRNADRSSSLAAIKRVISAVTRRMRLGYYTFVRRACHFILKGLKGLAPELQSLVMFAIDYHCIHYLAGSTGCEMVYGLKRSKIVNTRQLISGIDSSLHKGDKQFPSTSRNQKRVVHLTSSDKTKSAVLAALIPYWKERVDRLYSHLKKQRSSDHFTSNVRARKFGDIFLRLYPYIHLSHEGSIFLYQFAYLLEFTPYWSFSLHVLGVILRRITVSDIQNKDMHKHQEIAQKQTLPRKRSQTHGPIGHTNTKHVSKLNVSNLIRGAFTFTISYTLISGWYRYFHRQLNLRRRRWIAEADNYNTNIQHRKNHPIPPPPLPPTKLETIDYRDCADKWSCPLCHEPRINPTASTSGYVFCYKCLILKLRSDGEHCPLTGMPCKESQVVRLYESTAPRSSNKS